MLTTSSCQLSLHTRFLAQDIPFHCSQFLTHAYDQDKIVSMMWLKALGLVAGYGSNAEAAFLKT